MFVPITIIPLCLALCMVLFSCCCPSPECIKTQDVAVIQTSNVFLDGRFFDNLVVRNDNKVVKASDPRYTSIGSKCHKAKFPVHIEVQLFLRKTLRQSLEFDMPKNSLLSFYNGAACEAVPDSIAIPSGYTHEGEFYRLVQKEVNSGMLIDSSHSENACWVMYRMDGNSDWRCTQYDDERKENSCREE